MSRKGNCYDNAAMESFWATLKTECFGSIIPETRKQANLMIFDYIEGFYNRIRLHSALGYKSPLDFESPRAINPNNQKAPPRFFGARSIRGWFIFTRKDRVRSHS